MTSSFTPSARLVAASAVLLVTLSSCGADDDRARVDAAAAGGGSRIGADREVRSLDASEVATLCAWALDQVGGGGTGATCDGSVVYLQTMSECEDTLVALTCPITVGNVEDCWARVADDLCAFLTDDACSELLACAD